MNDSIYGRLLKDPTIQIPSDQFSVLNAISQAVVSLNLDERGYIKSRLDSFRLNDPLAKDTAIQLLEMDEHHLSPNEDAMKGDELKAKLLAAYLYDSAKADSVT